tara:strand:- start:399 stop:719 length:321 start_codon:yes stop_codon:yes gene_type:complete
VNGVALIIALLILLSATWQEYYDYAFQEFLDNNDPDDWAGREADYCIEQDEYACEYADAMTEDDDDDWDDDDDDEIDDDDRPGPGGQGLASQTNEEWFDTLGEFHS